MASKAEFQPQFLPPGFRFHPTDEELIQHYLQKRAAGEPCPAPIIAEVDIYKFNPWELPAMGRRHLQQQGEDGASYGCREWYFFSPRDRKYPNGVRPNRAAGLGYWKATGTDKPIVATSSTAAGGKIGVKKSLVFYKGKPPRGTKTNWIMQEYRLADQQQPSPFYHVFHPVKNIDTCSMRLDDWVLCKIYDKTHNLQLCMGMPMTDLQNPVGVAVGALNNRSNSSSSLPQLPTSRPSKTNAGSLANSGSLSDIFKSSGAVDNSAISQLLATINNPQMNHSTTDHLHQNYSPQINGHSLLDLLTAINSTSQPAAGYPNSGSIGDGSTAVATAVVPPYSGLHLWPPLPCETHFEAMASGGFCLKRQRESEEELLRHINSPMVTTSNADKTQPTDQSSCSTASGSKSVTLEATLACFQGTRT